MQAVGRRAVLIAPGSTQPITAAVHRPNNRSLQARFDPAQVGLKASTDFKWQVITAYDGATDEAPNAAVSATVPQQKVVGCTPGGTSYRTNGPRNQKVVALTFDDGPAPDYAGVHPRAPPDHVPATFFVITEQLKDIGDAATREAVRDGFEVGDHTSTHQTLAALARRPASQISTDQERDPARDRLQAPCLFRPPGGPFERATDLQSAAAWA